MRRDLDGHAGWGVDRVRRPIEWGPAIADVGPADLADSNRAATGDHDDARLRPLGLQQKPAAVRNAERVEAHIAPSRGRWGHRDAAVLAAHEEGGHRERASRMLTGSAAASA